MQRQGECVERYVRQQQQHQQRRSRRARALLAAVGAAVVSAAFAPSADAAQHIYTPTAGADLWSNPAANWSSSPTSGVDTQLTFVADNTTVVADGLVATTTNDLPG